MNAVRPLRTHSVIMALMLALSPAAWGQDAAQGEFQRGFYLQTHESDLAGAIGAYERVAQDAGAPEPLRAEARLRLAQCREDLASADFARFMPPEVLAYAEISNPGEHFARLARQMGLVREAGAAGGPKPGVTPLGNGAFFPHDFTLSPALLDALKAVRGAAVAVTGIDAQGVPEGLLVLHPGNADLIRGILESVVQFAEPAEPIEGFKTYSLQGQAYITVTTRLFLVSRTREPLMGAIGRLRDPQAPSLATSADLKAARPDRDGALFFAYLNGPRAAAEFRRRGQLVAGILDIDHLQAVSAFVRATDEGLQIQARLDLMEGHHNLIYALIRTAPCSRASLEYVPNGAAAVMLLGVNPTDSPAPRPDTTTAPADFVTAMDIGREFFANLEEAAVFVSPLKAGGETVGPPIPDVGLVLVAKDANRSEALWSQLLALPGLFMRLPAGGASQVTVEGVQATEYRFPQAPPVVLARVKDRAVVIGTRGAASAAIRSASGEGAITQDAGFKPLLARLTPSTSKAVLVHAGRLADMAASMARGREAQDLRIIASILGDLRVTLVTDEKPTQFTLRAEASGLPNVPNAIRKFAAAHQGRHPATQMSRAEPCEGEK